MKDFEITWKDCDKFYKEKKLKSIQDKGADGKRYTENKSKSN